MRNGDRIIAMRAPGVAAADSSSRQRPARQDAVEANCLARVLGAGGRITASSRRAKENRQRRGNHCLVAAYEQNQNPLSNVHWPPIPACRRTRKKSRSTSASFLPAMEGRATSTKSIGPESSC